MTHIGRALAAMIAVTAGAGLATGQAAARVDPTIARAQQRAAAGDSAAARVILDSLLASKRENDASRADVVYWLARLAASPSDRERGLTSFVVDYPFSPRVGPALFDLGMLELSHSDRERAAVHLARFLASVAADSNRTAASLALARLLFDRGEGPRACAVLLAGRAEVPVTAIEIRNQFEFSAAACNGVDTSVAPPPVDTAVAIPTTTTATHGEFTVQVAAYDSKNQADRLATKLRGAGLEARVIGTKKPFRVRVGHYRTHADAFTAMTKIDAVAGSKSFVVLIGPEEM